VSWFDEICCQDSRKDLNNQKFMELSIIIIDKLIEFNLFTY
jgi:hypothetical protein